MIETLANTSHLASRLRKRIAREGPMTFCDWMKAALYDQDDGYYSSERAKWGREGDYRTSPERSSLFAATFAGYFSKLDAELGSPPKWTLLECGAGSGHFAEGVLGTLQSSYPEVFAATSYVIDETSAHSRSLTERRLQTFADRVKFKSLDEVEIESGVVFSNELLDAFPVHRVIRQDGKLREFYVALGSGGDFEWRIDDPELGLLASLDEYFAELSFQLEEGQIAEVSLETGNWLRTVANKLGRGFVVTVDYGAATEDLLANEVGTLRGFRAHQFVDDLLARPGEHDLTTTVNWSFVKAAGERFGLRVVGFERQDKFLLAAGFLEQLEVQSRQCETEAERLHVTTAAREMILPDGMASHFQVLVQQKL